MEEQKTTSEYAYEDEYSYLNENNELVLKEGDLHGRRKLTEVEETAVEEKVRELKEAFLDLRKKAEPYLEKQHISEEEFKALSDEINTAAAIGDFDGLLKQLNTLMAEAAEEEEAEKEPQTKAEDTEAEQSEPEEPQANQDGETEEEESRDTKAEEEPEQADISYYKELAERAEDLAKQDDWPYVSMELDKLGRDWSDGPGLDTEEAGALYQAFTKTVEGFQQRKKEHYEQLNKQKADNLEKKKKLLAELKEIIEEEQWTATARIGKIKSKWNAIGVLPKGEGDDLDDPFNKLIKIFNEHKVDRLVQQRQKEEDNLMLKLIILDKMEKIVSSIDESTGNWQEVEQAFDDLTLQWKKIGRVPKEKSNEVWQRYKSAQDSFYDKRYTFDKEHRKQVDKRRSKKEQICSEAEALLEEKDIASAARKINKLHRRWKKTGNLPQRAEDELWSRFKAATDEFNKRKSDNIDKLKEQEEEHYSQKLGLIEQAEAIKDTTDWDKGHSQMQNLMNQWKKIGPVPRKKSNKIWKQFKGAMDVFYDRRREHFKEQKANRKENLQEKKEILDKLYELGNHEDPIEAVSVAKKLQEEFKNAGYVPIKKKDKMWKKYREACDVIYNRYRAAKSGNKFDQELAKADLKPEQRSEIQEMRKEFKKIKKEVSKLEAEALQYEESKTYFKPTNKGNALRDEIQQKIDQAQEKIQEKQGLLDSLSRKIEDIKDEA